jgi:hypothetical protein
MQIAIDGDVEELLHHSKLLERAGYHVRCMASFADAASSLELGLPAGKRLVVPLATLFQEIKESAMDSLNLLAARASSHKSRSGNYPRPHL